ncbi:Enoyl reductase (ER) domain-containing protein [Madurella fahalii]|uniref:Enoyl reductase (ER) domain-containing protein n=1 Tax=Madurella fahalii TaxID=1157608 RepID=A0ABQ0G2W5_9PEZI
MRACQYTNGVTAKTLIGKLEDSIALNAAATAPDKLLLAKDQLVIEVLSAALNPADYKMPEFDWFGRLFGLGKEAQPGLDFSGRIVGKHVLNTTYSEGQHVFGSLTKASKYGTLGELIVASTSELAALPDGIGADQAAALGTSAGIAYKSLLSGGIKPGCHIFINGGSGGVGTYSIQFAKLMGAKVTTSTSTPNVDLRSNVGMPESLYDQCHSFLKSDGTFVQVAADPTARATWRTLITMSKSMLMRNRRAFCFAIDKGACNDYALIGGWVADGKIKPVIGRTFGFNDVPQAYRELCKRRSRGKIIVHVSEHENDRV